MKKIRFISLLSFLHVISNNLFAIGIQSNTPNTTYYRCWSDEKYREYVHQLVFPISSDGANMNTIIQFTVLDVTDEMGVRIIDPLTNTVFENNDYSFAGGFRGPFTFNATNASSETYILQFYYRQSGQVIKIWKPNPTNVQDLRPVNYYFVTERQKTGTFTNSNNFNYKVNWVDSWLGVLDTIPGHVSANNFLAITEDALNFSWHWQIYKWDLCNGLPNNQLLDDNNEMDLYINGYSLTNFPYRRYVNSFAQASIASRNITFDCNIKKLRSGYIDEEAATYSTMGHEFFHNIQYSLRQGANIPDEMDWLTEGQAAFMQTLIMEEYSQQPNEEYLQNRSYYKRTKSLLNLLMNNYKVGGGPAYPNGEHMYLKGLLSKTYPYWWAAFWRYLFETYSQNNGQLPNTKAGLNIIKESTANLINPNTIQADMNSVLAAGGGTYNTLNKLLINFAENLYFCHDNKVSNFYNVDNSNMYATIRTEIQDTLYAVKDSILNNQSTINTHNEYVFDGSDLYVYQYSSAIQNHYNSYLQLGMNVSLAHPYQIQSREVFLTNVGTDLELTISNDINGDGNNTHVRAYIVDANDQILSSKNIDLNGQSSQTFNMPVVNATDKLILLFIRTDANANLTGDLTVDFAPLGNTTCAEFKADKTETGQGETVTFTNLSCTNATTWQWDFPGGNPAQSVDKNPQVTYQNQGTYAVTLTAINNNGQVVETKQDYITVNRVMANDIEFDFTYKFMKAISGTGTQYQFIGQVPQANLAEVQSWEWTVNGVVVQNDSTSSVTHIFPISEIISEVTLTVHFSDNTSKSKTQRVYHLGI